MLPFFSCSHQKSDDSMDVELSSLELRLWNLYSGRLDSNLSVSDSLAQPLISGDLQLSRGTAYFPTGSKSPSPAVNSGSEAAQRSRPATDALQSLSASGMEARLEPQASTSPGLPGSMAGVRVKNLNVTLGSELRAVYPLVVNLALSGNVVLNGALDPSSIVANGTVQLDGGMVNVLATQLRVERDQPGRITFVPEQGLDPTIDITLTAGEFKAVMQGRASNWQDLVVLSYVGTRSTTGEGTGQVQLTEASRLFQEQLASALVADDGQLAFSNLAASTVSTFSPKLDTQGQIGAARWRLVSAPSFPDMLSLLDPAVEWQNLLTSLFTGTEVEVQFGKSVQAVVAHKLRGAEYGTQWTMMYNLNNNLRMQLQVANSPPVTRTLLLQYSSEGVPK
ncbi:unnamed protein product [Ostreobium quekettii]|uniref:Translocation and assembly module TamB C-terminal domain-containing protein n=1 Tax=Ostreobium quekettii TaxID=121088 RepID=A0A8S1JFT0_9CHLO|nr:unnamed protein product [Ostreobium quekettii]